MTEKPVAPRTTPDRAQLAKFAKTIKLQEHVVLLDRDGTLNVDRPDYVKNAEELSLLPGVPEAVARLTQAGWRVLVVTNQACVSKGIISAAQLEEIHRLIAEKIAHKGGRIDRWYVCPHQDSDACDCRKPLPGLVNQARRDWRFEPSHTFVVGDAARDVAMARAAGCKPVLVLTGKGQLEAPLVPDVPAYRDLTAFVDALLAGSVGT